jgi:nicotinate-nucleotide adenylyltransferase
VIEFFRRTGDQPRALGILPGTFNPPTRAHLALARAGLEFVDEVLFVLPRVFPHKEYEGAGFEDRIELLRYALAGEPRFSIAATDRGLFLDIARECRPHFHDAALRFLCGRDAAERIMTWDYGRSDAVPEMLREFELLVASRGGDYRPPAEFADRIHVLPLGPDHNAISATQVRQRIALGEPWESLVPDAIVPHVRRIYLPPA